MNIAKKIGKNFLKMFFFDEFIGRRLQKPKVLIVFLLIVVALIAYSQCTYELHKSFFAEQGSVLSVAFSLDNTMIISGGAENTVRIWDFEKEECMKCFAQHTAAVNSVKFSYNGRLAASASDDKSIKIWDVESAKCIYTFLHDGEVNHVRFSHNDKFVLSGSNDNTVKIWDIKEGKLAHTFTEHGSDVLSLDISKDDKYVVSAGLYAIEIWEIETMESYQTIELPEKKLTTSVVFSPDSKFVYSGDVSTTVSKWDVKTGKLVETFGPHEGMVRSIVMSHDGSYLIAGNDDKEQNAIDREKDEILGDGQNLVRIWRLNDGECIKVMSKHSRGISSVDISSDGKLIVSGCAGGMIKIWKFEP